VLPYQLERWALDVIERVAAGGRVEDSRVEVKREWPNPVDAARLIAAHANAAHSAPILWLVGVDEKAKAVPGADYKELANWFPTVQAQFDEMSPMLQDLNVPYQGGNVATLCFETDRAPFVVRNPEGGRIGHEVPWREGTKTRSARRADLLRLLTIRAALPEVELLSASLSVSLEKSGVAKWTLSGALYISPESGHRVVIPYHRSRAAVELKQANLSIPFANSSLARQTKPGPIVLYGATTYQMIQPTGPPEFVSTEAVIEHPSLYVFLAEAATTNVQDKPPGNAVVTILLQPTGAEAKVTLVQSLEPIPPGNDEWASWYFLSEGYTFG
jgi:hypothetical protein